MKEYIFTIVGISLLCAFARMLSPEDDGKGTEGYIKLLCGLLLLCVVIEPIFLALDSLKDPKEELFESLFDGVDVDEEYYEKIYSSTLTRYSEDSISSGFKEMLIRELELSADDIEVYVELIESDREFIPKRATVTLYKDAIFVDPRDIESYVNGVLECECEIIYG